MKYVGVDLAPLKFTKEECAHRWLQWYKPMSFTSSPYNTVKVNLIAEEVTQGDIHDEENAFQWHSI